MSIKMRYRARDLRDPWKSRVVKRAIEPPAECEGTHCRTALEDDLQGGHEPLEERRWALAELTETAAEYFGVPVEEAVDFLWRSASDRPLSGTPLSRVHAHLVVWGEDPEAGPWYYALETQP